jgi:hypothetical protein
MASLSLPDMRGKASIFGKTAISIIISRCYQREIVRNTLPWLPFSPKKKQDKTTF